MKKIIKKEKIDIDIKDPSCVDDEGRTAEITLLGTLRPDGSFVDLNRAAVSTTLIVVGECLMLNLFDSAKFLMERGAFVNEAIQTGDETEPLFFHLMKNNPSLVFSPLFLSLLDKADLKLIRKFR